MTSKTANVEEKAVCLLLDTILNGEILSIKIHSCVFNILSTYNHNNIYIYIDFMGIQCTKCYIK